MHVDGFDGDDGNIAKCQKHGASIDEIEHLFTSGPFVGLDINHSRLEARLCAGGKTATGRDFIVIFTWRRVAGRRVSRPVGCRYTRKGEVETYEEAISATRQRR